MKILYITTIGETMGFFGSFIEELLKEGHHVDIATNENNGMTPVQKYYKEWNCRIVQISCSRSPLKIGNIRAIKEIKKIVSENKYDIVHCHTPVAAACTRLACRGLRKKGIKVFYTAHGFHFYTGAPLKNWLIYYLIEWICSWWTDTLITINKEDYERAARQFHAKKTEYVPGVGIDTKRFKGYGDCQTIKTKIRKELLIPEDAKLLLSVGELSKRKNHSVVINSLYELCDENIYYIIIGRGALEGKLRKLVIKNHLERAVKLLGFRTDIKDFLLASDLFVFPSIQEGLPVALMEAMAIGLPIVCSRIRGNTDLIEDGKGGYLCDCHDIHGFAKGIKHILKSDTTEIGKINLEIIKKYDIVNVNKVVKKLYKDSIIDVKV